MKTRTIETNGVRLRVTEDGQGPLVILLHGFPESAYSWRHQVPALATAGFRVVAPDQRGYGESDAPPRIEDFDIHHLTADVVGLVDALGEKDAAVVGHDWGALVAWSCALLHPKRFRAVAALSVAFTGRSHVKPSDVFRMIAGEDGFFYILYFQEPGVAERELERDVRRSLRLILFSAAGEARLDGDLLVKPKSAGFLDGLPDPEKLPAWLTEADLDRYTADFRRSGFRGPINWYRNFDRNWETTADVPQTITQPTLFITGDRDPVLGFNPLDRMKELVPNLRKTVMLPGCGHWTQQERPREVNDELVAFLQTLR